ncbi:hypothetical protein P3S67_031375 [Capsicum chacoense]
MKRKAAAFKKKKNQSANGGVDGRRKRTGPRLPNTMLKELQLPKRYTDFDDDEIVNNNDLYEYEEGVAEEESKKNRRFEDESVPSDEVDGDDDEGGQRGDDDEEEEEDDGRHSRLLQESTGLPTDAFDVIYMLGKNKKNDVIISEAYSESEYNPSRDILDGDGRISIQDLLDPLHRKPDHGKLRKSMSQMEKKSMPIHAPLPKTDQERLERRAAYDFVQGDLTKWEPRVKRNRGATAAEFESRSDFEKKIASLFNDHEVVEAHRKDGARLLELNKISVEDVRERQDQLAKMRSLLFRHEMKAMKQEFKRAEERLTLKHKNSSKWAKRILKRGLDVQDEGTRAAIAEQLNQHALLSRKANNMKESSSSEESSAMDDLDETSDGSDQDVAVKLLKKAKDKATEVLEGDEELPASGVLSLPFMVRTNILTGRRVFGAQKKQAPEPKTKVTSDNYYGDSDSEGETNAREIGIGACEENNFSGREVHFDPNSLREESEIAHDSLFKSFDNVARDPSSKTSYEVSMFADDSWKKMNDSSVKPKQTKFANEKSAISLQVTEPVVSKPDAEEIDEDSDNR